MYPITISTIFTAWIYFFINVTKPKFVETFWQTFRKVGVENLDTTDEEVVLRNESERFMDRRRDSKVI